MREVHLADRQTSEMVNCLHAAEAWLRSPANMDAALAGALTAPVTALLQTLLEQGVAPDAFWAHVVPPSASAILSTWWDSYRTLRPAWATALQALDRLLP